MIYVLRAGKTVSPEVEFKYNESAFSEFVSYFLFFPTTVSNYYKWLNKRTSMVHVAWWPLLKLLITSDIVMFLQLVWWSGLCQSRKLCYFWSNLLHFLSLKYWNNHRDKYIFNVMNRMMFVIIKAFCKKNIFQWKVKIIPTLRQGQFLQILNEFLSQVVSFVERDWRTYSVHKFPEIRWISMTQILYRIKSFITIFSCANRPYRAYIFRQMNPLSCFMAILLGIAVPHCFNVVSQIRECMKLKLDTN